MEAQANQYHTIQQHRKAHVVKLRVNYFHIQSISFPIGQPRARDTALGEPHVPEIAGRMFTSVIWRMLHPGKDPHHPALESRTAHARTPEDIHSPFPSTTRL